MKTPLCAVLVCVLAGALSGCGFAARENRPIAQFDTTGTERPAPNQEAEPAPIVMVDETAPSAWVQALPAFWSCPSRREWTWRAQPHFARRS